MVYGASTREAEKVTVNVGRIRKSSRDHGRNRQAKAEQVGLPRMQTKVDDVRQAFRRADLLQSYGSPEKDCQDGFKVKRTLSIAWTFALAGLALYVWYACYAVFRASRIDHDYSGVKFGEFYAR